MSKYEQKWWKFLAESEDLASQEDKEKIIRLLRHPDFDVQIQGFELANILLPQYIARAKDMALNGYKGRGRTEGGEAIRTEGLIKDLLTSFIDTDWEGEAYKNLKDDEKTPENLAKLFGISIESVDLMNKFRSKILSVTNIEELKEGIKLFYVLRKRLAEDAVLIDDEIFAPKLSYAEPYLSVPLKELFSTNKYGYTNFELYWVNRFLKQIFEIEDPDTYHDIGDVPF